MSLSADIEKAIAEITAKADSEGFYREPLVGYSSPSDPRYLDISRLTGWPCLHPLEMMADTGTVVSFFIPFSKKVVEANRRSEQVAETWAASYLHSNQLILQLEKELIALLKPMNIKAAGVPERYDYDPTTIQSAWPHKSAAAIAGLGSFGLNRMLITQRGCAGKLGTLFISEEIPPSPPFNGELCLFLKKGRCGHCLKSCPQQALSERHFDRFKCNERLLRVAESFRHLGFCDICGKCNVGPCAIMERA